MLIIGLCFYINIDKSQTEKNEPLIKKAVEHLVASHKHRLAAASRKIMHTMGRRTWGKYPVFSSNIYYIKMEKKSDR